MPVKWYWRTGASGPIPCEWLVEIAPGQFITVYLAGL